MIIADYSRKRADGVDRFMKIQALTVGRQNVIGQISQFAKGMWDAYCADYGPAWPMNSVPNITGVGDSCTRTMNALVKPIVHPSFGRVSSP